VKEKHSVTEPKHIQDILLQFLTYKTRVLENFTLQQQIQIAHRELRKPSGILLSIFSPPCLTTGAEESLLKQLPE